MENILIIEKTREMKKEGAINLLKYHRTLQEAKISRLNRQRENAQKVYEAIYNEIGRREKGDIV